LNSDCLAKIADFGLARSVVNEEEEDPQAKTEYIATRWYRAPEIVLGSQRYTKAIDMWSVGCILAEMLTGKALFPGKSTPNQIQLIIELLGKFII
jgi:mitogen-activated protein kinase 15